MPSAFWVTPPPPASLRYWFVVFVGVCKQQDSILLHVKVWDRNLLWYIGVFSAIYAFSRWVTVLVASERLMFLFWVGAGYGRELRGGEGGKRGGGGGVLLVHSTTNRVWE